MRKLYIALVAALLLCAWLWLRFRPAVASEPSPRPSVAAAEAGSERVDVAPLHVDPTRESASHPATVALESEALIVELVDEASGAPVAGVAVCAWRADVDPRHGPLAARALSDSAGLAHLPIPQDTWRVRGSSASRFGEDLVGAGVTRMRIELGSSRKLFVEVVDPAGRGLGSVLVDVFQRETTNSYNIVSGFTDADGRAEIDVPEAELISAQALLMIGTPLARSAPESFEFGYGAFPEQPLRFAIDPGGTIELRTTNARGEPLAISDDVEVIVDARKSHALPLPMGLGTHAAFPLRGGRLVVEHVALGLDWEAKLLSSRYPLLRVDFVGPTIQAERVRATLAVAEALPTVRGRLTSADGNPLARRFVSVSSITRATSTPVSVGWTDEAGWFEARWQWAPMPEVGAEVVVAGKDRGGPGVAARTLWPAPIERESLVLEHVYDLGTMICDIEPLLCSGRVVDAQGKAASRAQITVTVPGGDRSTTKRIDTFAHEDGSFAIHGATDAPSIELTANYDRQRTVTPMKVAPGATDVTITLAADGRIVGDVRLPESADPSALTLRVYRIGPHGDRLGFTERSLGGLFPNYENAMSAPSVCVVALMAEEHEIASSGQVEVRAGEVARVPTLDARGALHVLAIELMDAAGVALTAGGLDWVDADGCWSSTPIRTNGVALLHSGSALVDVVARAPGHRPRSVAQIADGARIVLERGVPVSVEGPALGADGARFVLELILRRSTEDDSGAELDETPLTLDSRGLGRMSLPGPGDYVVARATLVERNSGVRFELAIEAAPPLTLAEPNGSLRVEIAAGILEAALLRVR